MQAQIAAFAAALEKPRGLVRQSANWAHKAEEMKNFCHEHRPMLQNARWSEFSVLFAMITNQSAVYDCAQILEASYVSDRRLIPLAAIKPDAI